MSRLLSIDYGSVRVGIAISDPLKIIAKPYKTLTYKNGDDLIIQIVEIVNEKDAARAEFYKTFFDYNGPEDPRQFHLSINTTLIKLDPAISMILSATENFQKGLLTHQ